MDDISFLNCEKSYQPPGMYNTACKFIVNELQWYASLVFFSVKLQFEGRFAHLKIVFHSSALSACGCSFEDSLCVWVQGAADELDWLSRSGPTETPNTGPAGDHTTGKGHF